MKEYLKMSDVFDEQVMPRVSTNGMSLVLHGDRAIYASHATCVHDELVAEVERLNDDMQDILEMVDAAVRFEDFSIVAKIREKYISD